MDITQINIDRLNYLLKLYGLSREDLLNILNKNLKNKLSEQDIFGESIKFSNLKKIDKIFSKGLLYYHDPTPLTISKETSIFFRKNKFGTELNLSSKKLVVQFEELKFYLSSISKVSNFIINRKLPTYKITDNPKEIAKLIFEKLNPKFNKNPKEYLKSLISCLADLDIYVFEFIEPSRKSEKYNLDGFFLSPNIIVLKRQKSYRREIFTIIHEFGHYLLNEEEIEETKEFNLANENLSKIEKWCNNFTFYFLLNNNLKKIENIKLSNKTNDFNSDIIKELSNSTHLSELAIYTNLLFQNKISQSDYNKIYEKIKSTFENEKNNKKEIIGKNKVFNTPKPIKSPLFIATLQNAYYDGVINENDFINRLKIKSNEFNRSFK